ncbi:MAG: translation initiation factor IF-1 [Patescibacteria group bacterium]|jgi:translation initiation factor IF-1
MNQKDDNNTVMGIVTEALPNTLFRVNISSPDTPDGEEKIIISYLAGKMRMHRIKVLVGDKVEVLLDPYGGKGRIIKRT